MTIDLEHSRGAEITRLGAAAFRRIADWVTPAQPVARRVADAGQFWKDDQAPIWASDSHWRSGLGEEAFTEVGQDHLAMFETMARALNKTAPYGVVIEWGCGGGANAVAFAPKATAFLAADISAASLAECERQVHAACATPTEQILIDIEDPEQAVAGRENSCDVFLCVYVLECTAGREEALRIMRIAERLLVPGGVAFVQVKYRTASPLTRGFGRNYRQNMANMTTFGIDEFWLCADDFGLVPRLVTLVPRTRLDRRYAYYALTKP
jgi:SAM-dependent methyltransferase